jgi:hypothetical protein
MEHDPDFGLMVANASNNITVALNEEVTDASIRACNNIMREFTEDATDHWQTNQRWIAHFGAGDKTRTDCLT